MGKNDRGLKQHWLLVHSAQAEKRQTITLEKRIEKALYKAKKLASQLFRQTFGCEHDARRAVNRLEKKLSYHRMTYQIAEVLKYKGRVRPKNTDKPVFTHYTFAAELEACRNKVRPQRNKLGRFILATNDLNNPEINEANMLSTYREQQGVEKEFRFLKSPYLLVSSFYLNQP